MRKNYTLNLCLSVPILLKYSIISQCLNCWYSFLFINADYNNYHLHLPILFDKLGEIKINQYNNQAETVSLKVYWISFLTAEQRSS